MLCAIDPQATSLLVPMAQASLIAAPIVFRKELLRAARRIRRTGEVTDSQQSCDADDGPVDAPDTAAPHNE
jgi:hypothetical protein